MKNTFMELKLQNDTVVKLTLNFARLYKVKNLKKDLYERFMQSLNGKKDYDPIFSSLTVLYVAYLCANSDKLGDEGLMSEEEFMEVAPQNFKEINEAAAELISPKKK